MTFAEGTIQIHRRSKVDPPSGDILSLDLLVVMLAIAAVWDKREELEWQQSKLWAVSRTGLIALKRLRGSARDMADIEGLNRQG